MTLADTGAAYLAPLSFAILELGMHEGLLLAVIGPSVPACGQKRTFEPQTLGTSWRLFRWMPWSKLVSAPPLIIRSQHRQELYRNSSAHREPRTIAEYDDHLITLTCTFNVDHRTGPT